MNKNERFIFRDENWGVLVQDSLYDRIWAIRDRFCPKALFSDNPYKYNKEFMDKRIRRDNLDLSAPISVSWEITSNCNSNCMFCCNNSGEKTVELSLKKIKEIVDILEEWNCLRIIIGGGEPLMHKDILSILKLFENKKNKPAIATNGILLNKEGVLEQISKSCMTLQISLDSLDKMKYFKLRGIDALQTVKDNIILAKQYIKNIRIVTVLNKENENELEAIASFLNDIGIKQWFIFKMLPSGRGKKVINEIGIKDDSTIKERLRIINKKYLNLAVWYWGTQKSDGMAIYINKDGQLSIVDYFGDTKINFYSEEWDLNKIKEAWKNVSIQTKRDTIINFTSINKLLI